MRYQSIPSVAAGTVVFIALAAGTGRPREVPFEMHTLDLGANEPCAFADINQDGRLDIVSGENWYEAPGWKQHPFRSLDFTRNYIQDYSDLPLDVSGDGFPDIVSGTSQGKLLWWDENPGRQGTVWKRHVIETGPSVEFAILVDLDNDGGAREVLPQWGGHAMTDPLAWYEARDGSMVKHVVSSRSYGHGIGAGDVNGDGRADILTPKGWLEAPPDPRQSGWAFHGEFELVSTGFLYVLDVNGDGRADIVGSMAHDYGVFWLENLGGGQWRKHVIDDTWSQAHALTLADVNGDGQLDLITGKRYMAHNGSDPGEREPLGVYWYEFVRGAGGTIEWVKHVVAYGGRTGGGMQIPATDIDGDGDLDFAVAGKTGLFLFENLLKAPVTNKRR